MRRSLACLLLLIVPVSAASAADLPPALDRNVDFSTEIQPLLKKHCIACHGSDKQESGLRLDRADQALAGGDSGKAILIGKSDQSRLIHYVSGIDPDHLMPPEGARLTKDEIGLLRTWIDRGAEWPKDANTKAAANSHWAYQPLAKVTPPSVASTEAVRNPIDQFIVAKLESMGLKPSPEADRPTLIRRLALDLLGLLPRVEEVDAFVNDPHPSAYERLVDRFLESPHFGERWGRHWLDMARYADSDGYEKDNPRPDAYRYRDWVIDAINNDLPYDQFSIEQLAGDLLPDASPMQKLATAFHRQTLTNTEGGTDPEQFRIEACFDRTETTGAVWLGLTVGCARCHTHKYDAISQREYYQLFAFFNNGDEQTTVVPKSTSEIQAYELELERHKEQVAALTSELTEAQAKIKEAFIAWEQQMREQVLASPPQEPTAKPEKSSKGGGDRNSGPKSNGDKSSAKKSSAEKSSTEKSSPDDGGVELDSPLPNAIVKLLRIAPLERTDAQQASIFNEFSRRSPATKPLHEQLTALKKKTPARPEVNARILIQRVDKPRETFVLRRGEFLEPISDAQVAASGLFVLPPLKSRHSSADSGSSANRSDKAEAARPDADRLDLALWLVSTENPLTPRVTVNHVWQTLFGSGIVKTANDFGVRGERPTHPELLDWLAADFIGLHGKSSLGGRPAWSRKGLIKLIVMSGTYRQSSRSNPASRDLDPQNQWLSRQNRLRVEGEIVRDISLDAAGLLSRKVGGPSVYPPLPPGIAELSYAGNFKWATSTGEDQYRRGMYTFFKRTAPHPNLITFDCPDANLACVDRNTSNTPLQALVAMNNASFADAARGLASRILSDPSVRGDTERLEKAFRWCLARHASELERGQLVDMLSSSRAWYSEHADDAQKLAGKLPTASVSADEAASWIAVSRVLINLDEFITRE